jgi:hypothetical protein
MVGERRLGDVEERHELTHADLPGVPAEHVDELEADRIAQRLGDLGHSDRLISLHVGIDHRLTAGFPSLAFGLRTEFQIDAHQSTDID